MIILKKKKIAFAIIIILICMLVYELWLFIYNKNRCCVDNSIPIVAVPISDKTIVLDAGHGLPDKGAESNNGVFESKINLKIVFKLQKLFETAGANIILTRADENGIYDENAKTIHQKKVDDMKKRVEIGNESKANIFISIHLNKGDNNKYKGFQTFYKSENESKKLAQCIQNSLRENIRDIKRDTLEIKNKYIIKNISIPIVIIECGFLSNQEECDLLNSDEYQNKIAWAIYIGVMDYFYKINN